MKKEIISTDKAPKAIGPYSQAVKYGNLIFCSGQIPVDPLSGEIVENNIEKQTERVLKNLEAILISCNSSLKNVLKTTVFLKNMEDFQGMNKIYEEFFKENYPARSTVEVKKLPKDVLVEIEAIAFVES